MSFDSLPVELRIRIINESLEHPPPSSSSLSANCRVFNTPHAAALALTSQSCNAIVTPLLYRQVRITTPSSLRELNATLIKRPDLAALIIKLHIGAASELATKGWPVTASRERNLSIQTTLPQTVLPRWCAPGASFNVKLLECQEVTPVEKAIQAAMKDLDVDVFRSGFSLAEAQEIGVRAWSTRLFLLQAAVDVYLIKLREIDEASSDRLSSTVVPTSQLTSAAMSSQRYPTLKIASHSSRAAATAPSDVFVVGVGELWEHLLHPGGPADHFDHLVLLCRSTPQALGIELPQRYVSGRLGWHRVMYDVGGSHWLRDFCTRCQTWCCGWPEETCTDLPDYDVPVDEYQDQDTFPDWVKQDSELEPDDSESGKMARDALAGQKVEDLIEAARSVASRTPNVKTLCLTSYFHRLLSSLSSPSTLRSLVIGPKDRYWEDVLPSMEVIWAMKNLTRLRVVGMLSQRDAIGIGQCLAPRRLQQLEWEMPQKYINVEEVSRSLSGFQRPFSDFYWPDSEDDDDSPRKRPRRQFARNEDGDPEERSSDASLTPEETPEPSSKRPPRISIGSRRTRALLHPTVIQGLCARPGVSPQECKAWQKGTRAPGYQRPMKVAVSDAIEAAGQGGARVEKTDVAALYAKSLRWWLEG